MDDSVCRWTDGDRIEVIRDPERDEFLSHIGDAIQLEKAEIVVTLAVSDDIQRMSGSVETRRDGRDRSVAPSNVATDNRHRGGLGKVAPRVVNLRLSFGKIVSSADQASGGLGFLQKQKTPTWFGTHSLCPDVVLRSERQPRHQRQTG